MIANICLFKFNCQETMTQKSRWKNDSIRLATSFICSFIHSSIHSLADLLFLFDDRLKVHGSGDRNLIENRQNRFIRSSFSKRVVLQTERNKISTKNAQGHVMFLETVLNRWSKEKSVRLCKKSKLHLIVWKSSEKKKRKWKF